MVWRISGGKVSDVESQWWESQWRGLSVVGKSLMWKVSDGRVSGRGESMAGESQLW